MRAREWSPELGVFLSIDGLGYFDTKSTLWGWPEQNPYRYSDPTGHFGMQDAIDLWDDMERTGTIQDTMDFAAALSGQLTFGASDALFAQLGIAGQINNKCSSAHALGNGLGMAMSMIGPGGPAKGLGARLGIGAADGAKSAFNIAKEGGKHAGFLRNYAGKAAAEIQKGIGSIEKQIAEHQAKILNPEKFIDGWSKLDPRQQHALVTKKWPWVRLHERHNGI